MAPWLLPNAASGLVSIEPRHADVHENYVGPQIAGRFDGFKSVVGVKCLAAECSYNHAQTCECISVVVDNQRAAVGGSERAANPTIRGAVSGCVWHHR